MKKQNPEHKPHNETDPFIRLEMEIELRMMKPTERLQDVISDKDFEKFKKKMNKKGYE